MEFTTFGSWLKEQKKRDDPVGDLARDVTMHRYGKRADGAAVSRWLCRDCSHS